MNTISIKKISITDLDTDAVVNAANDGLWAGGGVCGAIFKAAGYDELQEACDKIGHCDVGSAVITPGFKLKAKYIIHAVGPRYKDGKHGERDLLYGAYYKSLELAVENNCKSIGFPLISAGIFGYPVREAWYVAMNACRDFLDTHRKDPLDIVFAVLSDEIIDIGHEVIVKSGASRFKIAEKKDWKTLDMPAQNETFIYHREFTENQMNALRRGNIPQEMEDKWFWYMEGNTLYAHRSWTGNCIFIIEFKDDNNHVVKANRDPEQFVSKGIEDDIRILDGLMRYWTKNPYDHYNQWLDETAEVLKKAGEKLNKLTVSGKETDAIYFHKPEEPYGYLSNWYMSPFDLDGMHFTSVEQYIMYRKCMAFNDEKSAAAVMATNDTAEQQEIGHNVSGYIANVWAGMRQMVVFRALLAKFSQNEELKKKLLNTGDAYLVECAHSDQIWACGIRLDSEQRLDAKNWKGTNILGFALMEVREMMKG